MPCPAAAVRHAATGSNPAVAVRFQRLPWRPATSDRHSMVVRDHQAQGEIMSESQARPRCHGCGAALGEQHDRVCDVARCRATGLQWQSCDHSGIGAVAHEPDLWTGRWPGEEDCERLGLFARLVPAGDGFRARQTSRGPSPISTASMPRRLGTQPADTGLCRSAILHGCARRPGGSGGGSSLKRSPDATRLIDLRAWWAIARAAGRDQPRPAETRAVDTSRQRPGCVGWRGLPAV